MTSVCVRTVKIHSTARRYATQDETEYYGIRKYSAQVMGESPHSIEKLMKKCHAWNLDQRQMQHLLMPIQGFLHVDNRSFYTVSEHASMTLAKVLLVVKQWPGMFCHDEIWAIVKQVLLKALFSKAYMTDLEQVLAGTGAIHHVEDETPDGWVRTREALVQLAVSLIEESRDPCARCTGCRDGPSMLERVGSLRETLDITRCLTEESTGSGNSILGEAILEALRVRARAIRAVKRF
ncbi:hypothetical protein N7471_010330 [Penicillium samsonianum]|uniref:uncharacterized protein n=1 Tax=Penicillium samsonianum TaxID=1882272 RepID=UPI0025470078|nr:uncharacterized protein N7471_010330 [Penicillium samsonianum]KAJ6125837.1 hypothetical protein N7471_010330 [Penicillium samsonianum]